MRGVIEIVVVENHMRLTCFLRQLSAALCDLRDFAVAVIVIDLSKNLSTASCNSGVDFTIPFAFVPANFCKSGGKSFAGVEWNENSWCNFTSNVKSSGVAAHQRSTILGSGTE